MKTIGNRIKIIIEYFCGNERGNRTKFAEIVGVEKNTVSNWIKRGTEGDIGLNVLTKITRAFPQINEGWLLTGDGSMLKRANSSTTISNAHGNKMAGKHSSINQNAGDVVHHNYLSDCEDGEIKEFLKNNNEWIVSRYEERLKWMAEINDHLRSTVDTKDMQLKNLNETYRSMLMERNNQLHTTIEGAMLKDKLNNSNVEHLIATQSEQMKHKREQYDKLLEAFLKLQEENRLLYKQLLNKKE
ncbi:MAG: hypothetical protein LBM61_04475 [Prevotellaceae bacterium]|jgi:plasmid maintenance system antidote protein VapI|nr:hypothetical protein [Prevotellaceae bacterium]